MSDIYIMLCKYCGHIDTSDNANAHFGVQGCEYEKTDKSDDEIESQSIEFERVFGYNHQLDTNVIRDENLTKFWYSLSWWCNNWKDDGSKDYADCINFIQSMLDDL